MQLPFLIKGWDNMRMYAGVSLSTLKRVHYKVHKIPLRKLNTLNPKSDVVVVRSEFEEWIVKNLLREPIQTR